MLGFIGDILPTSVVALLELDEPPPPTQIISKLAAEFRRWLGLLGSYPSVTLDGIIGVFIVNHRCRYRYFINIVRFASDSPSPEVQLKAKAPLFGSIVGFPESDEHILV